MKISVIVPVYKVEKYLDKCVSSLVAQTYRDLEIILVDDGSPDACPAICERWAEKDARIKVVHKSNGGLSDARNAGMALATGEYIAFVDSDDWIEPEMYELLLSAMMKNNADIVECKWEHFSDANPARRFCSTQPIKTEVFSSEEALACLIKEKKIKQTVVNKLYSKKSIDEIRFPIGKINEDEFWTYQIIAKSSKVVYLDTVLYHYYQREGSIIQSKYSLRRLDGIEALELRLKFMQQNFPSLTSLAAASYAGGCRYHYQVLTRMPDLDPERVHRNNLLQRYYSVKKENLPYEKSLKQRIWNHTFRHFPQLTSQARNFLRIGL